MGRLWVGEYALLELSPHLPENKDLSQFSEQEKKELLNEAEILKKMAYYKRKNNYWIHDETVDDEAFINTNELLCNMSKICFKDHNTKHCESLNMAEQRLKGLQKKKMLEEFDERFANSVEDMEDYLKDLVEKSVKHIKNLKKLDEVDLRDDLERLPCRGLTRISNLDIHQVARSARVFVKKYRLE